MCLSLHLRTERVPISETCFLVFRIPNNGQSNSDLHIYLTGLFPSLIYEVDFIIEATFTGSKIYVMYDLDSQPCTQENFTFP
jgi:hypothetical protein